MEINVKNTEDFSRDRVRDPHGRDHALSHNYDVTLGVLHELLSPRESINSMIADL